MELDGAPTLNVASFVNTGMDAHADKLMAENMNKNLVDFDEYPATQAIHARCISILADLWKVPKGCKAIGTATTGSSEAILLAGLAMKKRWQVCGFLHSCSGPNERMGVGEKEGGWEEHP